MSARRFCPANRADYFRPGGPRRPRIGRKESRMSLINDALRRASQAKPPPPQVPQAEAPLHPVEYKRPSGWPLVLIPVLLVLVLILASWFFVNGWQAERAGRLPALNTTPIAARETSPEATVAVRPRSEHGDSPVAQPAVTKPLAVAPTRTIQADLSGLAIAGNFLSSQSSLGNNQCQNGFRR